MRWHHRCTQGCTSLNALLNLDKKLTRSQGWREGKTRRTTTDVSASPHSSALATTFFSDRQLLFRSAVELFTSEGIINYYPECNGPTRYLAYAIIACRFYKTDWKTQSSPFVPTKSSLQEAIARKTRSRKRYAPERRSSVWVGNPTEIKKWTTTSTSSTQCTTRWIRTFFRYLVRPYGYSGAEDTTKPRHYVPQQLIDAYWPRLDKWGKKKALKAVF